MISPAPLPSRPSRAAQSQRCGPRTNLAEMSGFKMNSLRDALAEENIKRAQESSEEEEEPVVEAVPLLAAALGSGRSPASVTRSASSVRSAVSVSSAGKCCRICLREDVAVYAFCGYHGHKMCAGCVIRISMAQQKVDIACPYCFKSLCPPMAESGGAPVGAGPVASVLSARPEVFCSVCWCEVPEDYKACRMCDEAICEDCAFEGTVTSIVPSDHLFCAPCLLDGWNNFRKFKMPRIKEAMAHRNPAPNAPYQCQGPCEDFYLYRQLVVCSNERCGKFVCESEGCRKTVADKCYCRNC